MRQVLLLSLLSLALLMTGAAHAETRAANETPPAAMKWSGRVELSAPTEVPEGVTLSIAPGTVVTASAEGKLVVRGSLLARGTAEAPIRFLSAQPGTDWSGILIERSAGPNELVFCEIRDAGIDLAETALTARDTSISGGGKGITVSNNSVLTAERIAVTDVETSGVMFFVGARGRLSDSRIERADSGIELGQKGLVHISGTRVAECRIGLLLTGDSSIVEKSVFAKNETAILAVQSGRNTTIRGNLFTENATAVFCRQFSAPLITENTIRGSSNGIGCFQGSSPRILKNLFEKNERGISAVQLCQPSIEKNVFTGNKSAVYLTLSSYAVIRGNNFDANDLHVELDNMSADWEMKVAAKSPRGLAARNITMVGKGKAESEANGDPAFTKDYVMAQGNWWGVQSTAEMVSKGDGADIGAIKDYFDVPYRKYDGYEGEYVQDKVRYSKWLGEPATDAGPGAD